MTITATSRVFAMAQELGLSSDEMRKARSTTHRDALPFYVELRKRLDSEYADDRPFFLAARDMAKREVMPGRRDRKFYLMLTRELLRVRLIELLDRSGFDENGRRQPAKYLFAKSRHVKTAKIFCLTAHREKREVCHAR